MEMTKVAILEWLNNYADRLGPKAITEILEIIEGAGTSYTTHVSSKDFNWNSNSTLGG